MEMMMADLLYNGPLVEDGGRYIQIKDTRLFVVERGAGFPLLVLHGGPGLDHHMFGDYLEPLRQQYRVILIDQRSQGLSDPTPPTTWTLAQMAQDVTELAAALCLPQYAVLGHSYGAFVALQHAVDFSGSASATIISSGIPSARFLQHVEHSLAAFEPESMREQVTASWARERDAVTQEDVASLLHDQLPFHFANPQDSLIAEYEGRTQGAHYSPEVLQYFARQEYGGIEVEAQLSTIEQPVLVLAGRYDRTCSVEAAEAIARGVRRGHLVVFENSGHMTFAEENELYLAAVTTFLNEHTGS
jgi:proline iminopeptidase